MTALRFENAINGFRIENPEVRQALDEALTAFEDEVGGSKGAMAYVLNHLYSRRETDIDENLIGFSLPMRELNYAPGHPVYSITPRLLLKVPGTHRGGASGECITHHEEGPPQNKPIVGWEGTPLPRDSVLIYPNQEGDQKRVEERPVVQWSGVRPGENVLIARVDMTQEGQIASLIQDVIGEPPAGESIWQHYENTATIEDLSDILIALRKAGFSNQYSPKPNYLDTAKAASVGVGEASGLFIRDSEKESCAMVYIHGDIRFGYETQEEMADGGFATLVLSVSTAKGDEYRPVSVPFAEANYCYELNDQPVKPPEKDQMRFIDSHELRGHEQPFKTLLVKMAKINHDIRQAHSVPCPEDVALTGGRRGAEQNVEQQR